jgi:hypothetical protein
LYSIANQQFSWGPLALTTATMQCILEHLGNFPKMSQMLQAFGQRSSPSSQGAGSYASRTNTSGSLNGKLSTYIRVQILTIPDCCYMLRCAEQVDSSWSIRQFAVHERREDRQISTFFLIKHIASQSLNQRLKALRIGSTVPQGAIHVHAMFASAATTRWDSYATSLEDRLHELVGGFRLHRV